MQVNDEEDAAIRETGIFPLLGVNTDMSAKIRIAIAIGYANPYRHGSRKETFSKYSAAAPNLAKSKSHIGA